MGEMRGGKRFHREWIRSADAISPRDASLQLLRFPSLWRRVVVCIA